MALAGHRRRWLYVLAGVLVAGVVVGVILVVAAKRSQAVPLQTVLERFRTSAGVQGAEAPAAGVYTYRVEGSESGGAGPLRVTRDLPTAATLTVTRTADGWQTETIFSEQHVEAARMVVRDGFVQMVWRRVDVTFAGFGRDDRRDINGRSRIAPVSPQPKQTWADTYLTGTLRNAVASRVVRRESVDVGEVEVATHLINSTTTTEGVLSGSRSERLWWSAQLRIPVRAELDVEVGGVFGYSSRIQMTLVGVTPAT